MHRIYFLFVTAIISLALSCNKSPNSNPVSYVDSYQPQLLEPRGTVHSENYFPMQPGLISKDSGISKISLSLHTSASGPQGGSQDTTEIENVVMVSMQSVGAQETISVAGKSHTVTPITTVTTGTVVENDSSMSVEQIAFYEDVDTAVSLCAIIEPTDSGNDTISITNGIILKKPLVVGSQWETTPTYAFSVSSGIGNIISNMKIHSVVHVVGKENIVSNGRTISALRLDQVSEVSYSLSGDSLTGNEDVKSTSISYLEKDTGTVKQQTQETMSMNMSMVLFGTTMTQNETSQISLSQDLISFATGTPVLLKTIATPSALAKTLLPHKSVSGLNRLTKSQIKRILTIQCLKKALLL
jgi:hypothetical protein